MDGTGVGYGVRGSTLKDITVRFKGKSTKPLEVRALIWRNRYRSLVPQQSTKVADPVQLLSSERSLGYPRTVSALGKLYG